MTSEKCPQQKPDLRSNVQCIDLGKPRHGSTKAEQGLNEEPTLNKATTCTETFRKTIKPPAVKSLMSICGTITSDRADLVSVDRFISLLDKTVSEMKPETVLPEMKCMLLDTILFVADSPEKFPFKVRQGILEAALGCEVFDAQSTMIQKRLFSVWDRACWECNANVDDASKAVMRASHPSEFEEVYCTERLRGEARCHTLPTYQNLVLDDGSTPSIGGHRSLHVYKNREFTRWWREHDINARRAFLTSDQDMWLPGVDKKYTEFSDNLLGLTESYV